MAVRRIQRRKAGHEALGELVDAVREMARTRDLSAADIVILRLAEYDAVILREVEEDERALPKRYNELLDDLVSTRERLPRGLPQ